ncbi:putative nuclear pore protein [Erysiphe necator]|uniref:Putative nuclear pore protein n=1 Tax=Uncinula necator TaxID=52586 RepID=A0A0B1P949_UNCNE|nr:putative nuclear pore protein [Erysiphe necator]
MEDQASGELSDFCLLQHGHRDMVSATTFNSYGNRFGTGSVDGTIKVHNKNKDGSWHLCDSWSAHSSEIHQIQWLPATIYPNLIASLAADGKFRIWAEDPAIPSGKGRRFNSSINKHIFELCSKSRSTFISFTITHNHFSRHSFLALIDRSGSVVAYENNDPENLESWVEIDSFVACEKPARGEEISFKIAFDPNLSPTYTAIMQGVPKDALGLVVAAMYTASVWRTREITHSVSLGSETRKEFYRAIELSGHKGLVRDIAWSPGNVRGHDVIATVCKDGYLRVFKVWTPSYKTKKNTVASIKSEDIQLSKSVLTSSRVAAAGPKNIPSSFSSETSGKYPASGGKEKDCTVVHLAEEITRLTVDESCLPPWKVEFDADGLLIGTTSDDGKVSLWKRDVNGIWAKFSELVMERNECD